MAWFLAMQGPPSKLGQSLMYELAESADRQKLAEEMSSAATLDRVVPVPAVFGANRQEVTLYVRPPPGGVGVLRDVRRGAAPDGRGRQPDHERTGAGCQTAAGRPAAAGQGPGQPPLGL